MRSKESDGYSALENSNLPMFNPNFSDASGDYSSPYGERHGPLGLFFSSFRLQYGSARFWQSFIAFHEENLLAVLASYARCCVRVVIKPENVSFPAEDVSFPSFYPHSSL